MHNFGSLRQQREREAKKQADLKSSETNLLKKLDRDVYDEQNQFSTVWGPPQTRGPGQTAPVAPPPPLSAALATMMEEWLKYSIWACKNCVLDTN